MTAAFLLSITKTFISSSEVLRSQQKSLHQALPPFRLCLMEVVGAPLKANHPHLRQMMLQKVRLLRLHKGVPLAVQQQRGRRNGRQGLLEVHQTEVVARRKVLLEAADKVDVLAPQAAHQFPVPAVGGQVELQLRGTPVGEVLRPEDIAPGDGPAATGDGALQDE